MEDRVGDFLSSCSEIDFGPVDLSDGEKKFYSELNKEIILLCKSLPESTHTDALLFFMGYSKTPFGQEINFFRNYYVPTWSIIYWLIQSDNNDKGLGQKDIKNAITAHSMAMCLHSLDDHLTDKEMPVTHLTLLLRSQSWMIMNNAFTGLADGVNGGEKIVQSFMDEYYSGIRGSEAIESLDSYCDIFRKQMATGLIAPVLMTKRMTGDEKFVGAIQNAYGSFGTAWRLLDDIQDIEKDMSKGVPSSIYFCLSEDMRILWDKNTGEKTKEEGCCTEVVLDYVLENRVIDIVKERICSELESAAAIADYYDMTGWADEFRSLLRPLKNTRGPV